MHYRDAAGRYLGAWDGATPPAGAIAVTTPPPHRDAVWTGSGWTYEAPLPPLTPPQWGFLRRRDGGRLGAVIEAAKAIMPPGDLADMFAEIVDASPSINIDTVLDLTARVRALAPLLDVPTDAEIRSAWAVAQNATPERLKAALAAL